ncbi:MAG: hypothetical protein NVSMB25_21130 [Thermoleophilaceae bacterium]
MAESKPDRRRDPRRRAAVDIALALAELNAGWGDQERAREHLRAADELSGGRMAERLGLLARPLSRSARG